LQIDLRLLKHAQALAQHGSFSRAANALNIAQPTLSRGIKELETRVGLPLFSRSRSGIEPTDFGRVFLQHAVEVMAGVSNLDREVALAKGLETGEVSVGLGPYVAEALAPTCAARFAAAHPAVRLRILMDAPAVVARLLRERAVDLGVAEASVLDAGEDFEVVATLSPLVGYVVVRAQHPLVAKTKIDLSDLLKYPFAQVVMLPPRLLKPILAARQSVMEGETKQVPPFPAIECPTLRLASNIVVSSNAFTIATLGMVRAELDQGLLVPVYRAPWMRTNWSIFRLRKRTMSPAMIAFSAEIERTHAEVVREEDVLSRQWQSLTNADL